MVQCCHRLISSSSSSFAQSSSERPVRWWLGFISMLGDISGMKDLFERLSLGLPFSTIIFEEELVVDY